MTNFKKVLDWLEGWENEPIDWKWYMLEGVEQYNEIHKTDHDHQEIVKKYRARINYRARKNRKEVIK